MKQRIVVDALKPVRADLFLLGHFPDLSRQKIKNLIDAGHVLSNGQIVKKPGLILRNGMELEISLPAPLPDYVAGEKMDLQILYEDSSLLILDKQAGLVVHPSPGHAEGTLVNGLLYHCAGQLSGAAGDPARPGIVHRLDRDTTGLMVIAKTDKAHRLISAQFAERTVKKIYRALVKGVPGGKKIEGHIGRHPVNRKQMAIRKETAGKYALTNYNVGRTLSGGKAAVVECRPKTGRTHQIRVHMASIGHPLLGDTLYGFRPVPQMPAALQERIKRFNRHALHAGELAFTHPEEGRTVSFQVPPPQDFQELEACLAEESDALDSKEPAGK